MSGKVSEEKRVRTSSCAVRPAATLSGRWQRRSRCDVTGIVVSRGALGTRATRRPLSVRAPWQQQMSRNANASSVVSYLKCARIYPIRMLDPSSPRCPTMAALSLPSRLSESRRRELECSRLRRFSSPTSLSAAGDISAHRTPPNVALHQTAPSSRSLTSTRRLRPIAWPSTPRSTPGPGPCCPPSRRRCCCCCPQTTSSRRRSTPAPRRCCPQLTPDGRRARPWQRLRQVSGAIHE